MLHKTLEITVNYEGCGLEPPKSPATLTSYVLDVSDGCYFHKRPAVIICPGGAYQEVAMVREGEPVAAYLNGQGIQAFVLNYSTAPMRFPGALMELSMAVVYVRAHAEEYHIDENKIILCGFSAGGHLAASLGVYWKEGFLQRYLGFDNDENRPDGLILSYPVISGKEGLVHAGTAANLLGKYPDERELSLFSLEDHVSDITPPTFLWHTAEDSAVPAGNSMVFAQALAAHDIPYELHIYPKGIHGLSLATPPTASYLGLIVPEVQNWIDMAIRFITQL